MAQDSRPDFEQMNQEMLNAQMRELQFWNQQRARTDYSHQSTMEPNMSQSESHRMVQYYYGARPRQTQMDFQNPGMPEWMWQYYTDRSRETAPMDQESGFMREQREAREREEEARQLTRSMQWARRWTEAYLAGGSPALVAELVSVDRLFAHCTATTSTTTNKSTHECRICFLVADHPIGCTACKQLVGCLSCCKKWAEASMESSGTPSCPSCRGKWESSDSVEEVKDK